MLTLPLWGWVLALNFVSVVWYLTGYVLDLRSPLPPAPAIAPPRALAVRALACCCIVCLGVFIVAFFTVIGLRGELTAARARRAAQTARRVRTN